MWKDGSESEDSEDLEDSEEEEDLEDSGEEEGRGRGTLGSPEEDCFEEDDDDRNPENSPCGALLQDIR